MSETGVKMYTKQHIKSSELLKLRKMMDSLLKNEPLIREDVEQWQKRLRVLTKVAEDEDLIKNATEAELRKAEEEQSPELYNVFRYGEIAIKIVRTNYGYSEEERKQKHKGKYYYGIKFYRYVPRSIRKIYRGENVIYGEYLNYIDVKRAFLTYVKECLQDNGVRIIEQADLFLN